MNNKIIAKELFKIAKKLLSMDFPTENALKKYLKEHPDADKSRHKVVPVLVQPKTKIEPKSYTNDSDDFFDKMIDSPSLDDEHANHIREISNFPPTKSNYNKLKTHLSKTKAPWAESLKKVVNAIDSGNYKHEFKNIFGPHSQVSELFSHVNQAFHYNKSDKETGIAPMQQKRLARKLIAKTFTLIKDVKTKKGTEFKSGERMKITEWKNEYPYMVHLISEENPDKKLLLLTKNLYKYVRGISKPPSINIMEKWTYDGIAKSILGNRVEPDGFDPDNSPSWLLVMGMI